MDLTASARPFPSLFNVHNIAALPIFAITWFFTMIQHLRLIKVRLTPSTNANPPIFETYAKIRSLHKSVHLSSSWGSSIAGQLWFHYLYWLLLWENCTQKMNVFESFAKWLTDFKFNLKPFKLNLKCVLISRCKEWVSCGSRPGLVVYDNPNATDLLLWVWVEFPTLTFCL